MFKHLLAGIRTFVLVPLFFLLTLFLATVIIVYGLFRPASPLHGKIVKQWSRLFLRIPPVRYEIEGIENIDPKTRYVVASNHLSAFDVPLLLWGLPLEGRFLTKQELFKIPLVGIAMSRVGMIKINREAGRSSRTAIKEGVELAAERGYSLIVFPEGTRGSDGELLPFKKGGFRIAIDTQLPVLPVIIEGSERISKPGSKVFHPGQVRVKILPPVPTEGLTNRDNLNELFHSTEAAITEGYADLRSRSTHQS
jgi:1-acyl-sn-glycerol-3-phosphate acyltransferase